MRSVILSLLLSAALTAASLTTGMKTGKLDLKSAGALAFGPDGILFIGDSLNAAVVAIDTRDATPASSSSPINIERLDEKLAAFLGTDRRQILIDDIKVNPLSKTIYLAVSRGRGPDATPVILKSDPSGNLSELSLDNVPYSSVTLPNAPASRRDVITQMAYVDGRLLVAGLSNEEFASNLRSIPFPFSSEARGTSVEIYHGSHGQFETQAPVRTFVPWIIHGEPSIIAAYTCTPLVTIPLKDLKPGAKVTGRTIAELGAGNRPLDMITYRKDGHDYILMANSKHGVIKIPAEGIGEAEGIKEAKVSGKAGVGYETIASLKGVVQLDRFDKDNAILLIQTNSGLNLETIELP